MAREREEDSGNRIDTLGIRFGCSGFQRAKKGLMEVDILKNGHLRATTDYYTTSSSSSSASSLAQGGDRDFAPTTGLSSGGGR